MVTHAQNPSTQEAESGGFLGTPGQHGLHNEILSQPKQTKCAPKQTAATKSTTEKEFKYVATPVIEWVPGHLFILLPYPTVQHKNPLCHECSREMQITFMCVSSSKDPDDYLQS